MLLCSRQPRGNFHHVDFFFFFNDTATTEIYTLSLHDALPILISVTNCPVNAILMRYGSEAQKQQWLAPLARGEMLGAFCLTEPHVGSDASALRTTATRDGSDYVINGVKQFITSGKNGDVAIVIAVTDKAAGKRGMSAFIVPTSAPGYQVLRLEDKLEIGRAHV